MTFEELGLELKVSPKEVRINGDLTLVVEDYLPMKEKIKMIEFIALSSMDAATGTFSPARVELYFGLAICKWYAGIELDEKDPAGMYDVLETNGVLKAITEAIPQSEFRFISELVEETIKDMAAYNSSAAGIIQNMSSTASDLDVEINKILGDIQSGKGIEVLSEIKNVVGKDRPVVVKKG